ncbi:hypothetical protein IV102_15775 [bacterium]|nr:hypothetical protein [bacterium]
MFTKFQEAGGVLREDHGFFRIPFSPRYTQVTPEQAAALLHDSESENLVLQAPGEQATFALDSNPSQDLRAFEAIYLGSDSQVADNPGAASAVRNLLESGYQFRHQGEPLAGQIAYDHFAHTRFGSQYLEAECGPQKTTFHTAHDIGSYDYFCVSGDLQSVQEPEVAQLISRWEKDGTLMGSQSAKDKFDHFTCGTQTHFFAQGISLASVQGGGAKELEQAHDRALAQRPFVDLHIAPEVAAGRMDTEDMGKIYRDVVLNEVAGTTREERFQAFSKMNESLLQAQAKDIGGWALVEFNRTSLDFYNFLAEASQPGQFKQALERTTEVLQSLPDFQPTTVVTQTLEAAKPYLKEKSPQEQANLITRLSQRLEHLAQWSETN